MKLSEALSLIEAAKFVPADKAFKGGLSKGFDKAVTTVQEIGRDNVYMAGTVFPDGSWTILLANKPKTAGAPINRLLAKGKSSSVATAKKDVVAAFLKAKKKI